MSQFLGAPGGFQNAGGFNSLPQEYKLFVGNLPSDISEEDMRTVFSTYGVVLDVHLMCGRSQSGAACAFVHYADQLSADQAISALNKNYKIRIDAVDPITVSYAKTDKHVASSGYMDPTQMYGMYPPALLSDPMGAMGGYPMGQQDVSSLFGAAPQGGMKGKGKGKGRNGRAPHPNHPGKIFVGNLPTDITKEVLHQVFSTYGIVTDVHVMTGKSDSGQACAFVEYATQIEAQTAINTLHQNYEIRENNGKIVCRFYEKPDTTNNQGSKGFGGTTTKGTTNNNGIHINDIMNNDLNSNGYQQHSKGKKGYYHETSSGKMVYGGGSKEYGGGKDSMPTSTIGYNANHAINDASIGYGGGKDGGYGGKSQGYKSKKNGSSHNNTHNSSHNWNEGKRQEGKGQTTTQQGLINQVQQQAQVQQQTQVQQTTSQGLTTQVVGDLNQQHQGGQQHLPASSQQNHNTQQHHQAQPGLISDSTPNNQTHSSGLVVMQQGNYSPTTTNVNMMSLPGTLDNQVSVFDQNVWSSMTPINTFSSATSLVQQQSASSDFGNVTPSAGFTAFNTNQQLSHQQLNNQQEQVGSNVVSNAVTPINSNDMLFHAQMSTQQNQMSDMSDILFQQQNHSTNEILDTLLSNTLGQQQGLHQTASMLTTLSSAVSNASGFPTSNTNISSTNNTTTNNTTSGGHNNTSVGTNNTNPISSNEKLVVANTLVDVVANNTSKTTQSTNAESPNTSKEKSSNTTQGISNEGDTQCISSATDK